MKIKNPYYYSPSKPARAMASTKYCKLCKSKQIDNQRESPIYKDRKISTD